MAFSRFVHSSHPDILQGPMGLSSDVFSWIDSMDVGTLSRWIRDMVDTASRGRMAWRHGSENIPHDSIQVDQGRMAEQAIVYLVAHRGHELPSTLMGFDRDNPDAIIEYDAAIKGLISREMDDPNGDYRRDWESCLEEGRLDLIREFDQLRNQIHSSLMIHQARDSRTNPPTEFEAALMAARVDHSLSTEMAAVLGGANIRTSDASSSFLLDASRSPTSSADAGHSL